MNDLLLLPQPRRVERQSHTLALQPDRLIWLDGVALAPDQLDFSGELPAGDQLCSDGEVFLHGVSFGVEARW